jgi:hypothetical protein
MIGGYPIDSGEFLPHNGSMARDVAAVRWAFNSLGLTADHAYPVGYEDAVERIRATETYLGNVAHAILTLEPDLYPFRSTSPELDDPAYVLYQFHKSEDI